MYYVGKNGSQSGPYPLEELKSMATSGKLAPADLVWTNGMSEWKPASAALPELFPISGAAPTPPPGPESAAESASTVLPPAASSRSADAPDTVGPAGTPATSHGISTFHPTTPPLASSAPPMVEPQAVFGGAPIPTYLWQSIVCTLFCCLLTGIPAIVFSSQVESKRQHGDLAGAVKASQNAKLWCWISLAVGILQYVLMGGMMILFFGRVMANLQNVH